MHFLPLSFASLGTDLCISSASASIFSVPPAMGPLFAELDAASPILCCLALQSSSAIAS
ncbi:hypothetical protein PF005_g12072 [Phytophthora fragariae]|uniref:Uncharacterized protein n=2 Tax=Phytophthora TaxID=4783 RepID=A0A6A3TW61_9STRA|nr:hypothetical protein PF009_g11679 [Phytophthora fragariae]KAE9027335.1 hypothetical protein PR001_g11995 [Phytophthora rubi]KAE9007357.1 hypothetical protein PF011_g11153 [Phytophthora fragariae]KAE9028278.1 hypothetical protein PR002_g10439 [Phytophthora rubi]KAE9109140.1 hypothetical protein PF010_g11653 [Phytophthora fragariae]